MAIYAALGVGERMLDGLQPTRARRWRPWLWLAAPMALVGIILVYPLVVTVIYAFGNASTTGWVGLRNFIWAFSGDMTGVIANTGLWVLVLPLATLVMAFAVGVLFDRVRYERLAMTLIILPTAISFTAAAIIWRQFYSFQPDGSEQLGLLNACGHSSRATSRSPGCKPRSSTASASSSSPSGQAWASRH